MLSRTRMYGSGIATVRQTGAAIEMFDTFNGNSAPGPHYKITATLSGREIRGHWVLLVSTFNGKPIPPETSRGGSFVATVGTDGTSITVSQNTSDNKNLCNWQNCVYRKLESVTGSATNQDTPVAFTISIVDKWNKKVEHLRYSQLFKVVLRYEKEPQDPPKSVFIGNKELSLQPAENNTFQTERLFLDLPPNWPRLPEAVPPVGAEPILARPGSWVVAAHQQVSERARAAFVFHVVEQSVDYSPWALKHTDLKLRVQESEKVIEYLKSRHQEKVIHSESIQGDYQSQKRIVESLKERWKNAKQQASEIEVPDTKEGQRYRLLENRLSQSLNTMSQLHQEILETPPKARGDLLANYDALKRSADTARSERDQLASSLGLAEQSLNAQSKLKIASDRYWGAQRTLIRLQRELETAVVLSEGALRDYLDACQQLDDAQEAFHMLDRLGSPLITQITSNDENYKSRYLVPKVIEEQKKRLQNLKSQVNEKDKRRRHLRNIMVERSQNLQDAGEALVSGYWKSAFGQVAVESGFFLYDVLQAPYISIAAKISELTVFGPPTYYDFEPPAHWKVEKAAQKRAKKNAMKRSIKTMAAAALKADGSDQVWTGWVEGTFLERIPLMRDLDEAEATMRGEIAKLSQPSEYLKELTAPKLAGKVGKFGLGLAKDLGKDQLKRQIVRFIETEGFRLFMEAQTALLKSTADFTRASQEYWKARDRYEQQREFRRQLLELYDPDEHLLVVNNSPTSPEDEYTFWLSDRGSNENRRNSREIHLWVGGVKAQRHKSGALKFTVPSASFEKITTNSTGGVAIRIVVEE